LQLPFRKRFRGWSSRSSRLAKAADEFCRQQIIIQLWPCLWPFTPISSVVGEELTGQVFTPRPTPFHRQLDMAGILFDPNASYGSDGAHATAVVPLPKTIKH